MTPAALADARRRYAEMLRQAVGVRNASLVQAFAGVPRERFLPPPPWKIPDLVQAAYRETTDPLDLYRDVLVAIDPSRRLHNGQPSAHAMWMDALDVAAGEHVVHVGCGMGYYTAILAETVGAGGRVTALERDAELAASARANLAAYPNVTVVHADGCRYEFDPAHAVYVNAGATHPLPLWLDRLVPGGRLIVPIVRWPSGREHSGASGSGVLVRACRGAAGYAARIVSLVWIFPCIGAVDVTADRRLGEALASGVAGDAVRSLRRERHERDATCWLHGDGYCLSLRPPN